MATVKISNQIGISHYFNDHIILLCNSKDVAPTMNSQPPLRCVSLCFSYSSKCKIIFVCKDIGFQIIVWFSKLKNEMNLYHLNKLTAMVALTKPSASQSCSIRRFWFSFTILIELGIVQDTIDYFRGKFMWKKERQKTVKR